MKVISYILLVVIMALGASTSSLALDYNADLALSLTEQYNDNIFLSHSDKVGDYSTVIAPSVALSTRTEKSDVMINYSPTFIYYNSNSERNSISHQASGTGHIRISEVAALTLSDSFVQSKDSLIIRSIEGAGPVTRSQETITTNTLSGSLSYRLTEQLSLEPALAYTSTENSQTDISNIDTIRGSIGVNYLITGRTTLRTGAAYTHYDYSIGSDANSQDYILGVNHRFTPTITADLYGGFNMTQIDGGQSDTGYIGGISITKRFETGEASIAYVHSVIPGLQNSSPLKSQLWSLRYSAPVTAYLDATVSGSYGHYKALGGSGTDQDRVDMSGSAGLSYRLSPWASLTVAYTYVNSDDKVDKSGSYTNQVIAAGIRLSRQARF